MINGINLEANKNYSFSGKTFNLCKNKMAYKFVKSQEDLSTTRFIQGTLTNWFPKAVFSRSLADFSEFTFLEFIESGIFYFAAPFLGEKLFRNGLFKNLHSKEHKTTVAENLAKSVSEIKKSGIDKVAKNKIVTTKAGILLACVAVPAAEYALGFAKNLFTLKLFKISDFNNVANLNKKQSENTNQQSKVENHSKSVIKKMGALTLSGIAGGVLLAKYGYKSKIARKFSEALLEPGEKIAELLHKSGIHSKNTDKFLREYLKLDFDNSNGKFALSKGQLALTCITGLFGYANAAKDRGLLDYYEVLTRVPLVVLYTIFGSALLDSRFKKYLAKKGKYPDLIQKDEHGAIKNIPSSDKLSEIAEKLALKNKTLKEQEFQKLIRQKAIITGVPYFVTLVCMGFILSGVTRLCTQYRYNKQYQDTKRQNTKSLNVTNGKC